jgi:pilus assembly protein CpaF
VREQIASAFDLIVHLIRLVDGSRRVSRVTEVSGLEGDVVTLQDLFLARSSDDEVRVGGRPALLGPLRSTGLRPNFLPKLATHGVDLPNEAFEEALA